MCKGSQTTTQNTTSSNSPTPEAMQSYQDLLRRASGVASQPYTPFTGEMVAPVNAQQQLGVANINAMQGYYPTAIQMALNAAKPLTADQITAYMNPYTQKVVDTTQAQFANQNAQALEGLRGRAISQGALGGNRQGIAEAELANQQALAQNPIIANLYSQGYNTSLNTALTEQQMAAQGAYGVANMANAGLSGANAQIGAGGLYQQTQQAQDAAAYQQYLQQLGYPFQTAQWLAGIATGVGSQMGGTTSGTGTTTGPPPNMTSQLLGGAMGGVGLMGATGAFGSTGWLAPLMLAKRGGRINGYADGGGVANLDTGDGGDAAMSGDMGNPIPESDETLAAQQRQLVAGHRRAQMFPNGSPELPVPHGMARTVTPNGTFHFNPNQVSADDVHNLSAQDRENELLDLGPVNKREVAARVANGEQPSMVVERDPQGTEVRSAPGTLDTAPAQMAAMHKTKSPGHSVKIENPYRVLAQRLHAHARRAIHRDVGGQVMPYSGGKSWIPPIGIAMGHGAPGMGSAPGLPQDQNAFDINKQGKNLGYLSDAIKGLNGGKSSFGDQIYTSDQSSYGGAGLSADLENPTMYARGGTVGIANGYADGGSPYDEAGFADLGSDLPPAGGFDEAGFADFVRRADLAAISPSSDYDRFEYAPTTATPENVPELSVPRSSSFDEAGGFGTVPTGPGQRAYRYAANGLTSPVVAPSETMSLGDELGGAGLSSPLWTDRVLNAIGATPPQQSAANVRNWLPSSGGGQSAAAPVGVAPPVSALAPNEAGFQPPTGDLIPTLEPGYTPGETALPMPSPRPDIAGPAGQGFAVPDRPVPAVSRDSVRQDSIYYANKYGIPTDLFLRLIHRESGFNPNARGAAGEIGPGQLMPGTARELGVNPYDTTANIEGAARYLKQNYDKFGNWQAATAAYNAGPNAVAGGHIPASTRAYVAAVAGGEGAPEAPPDHGGESGRALAFNGGANTDLSARSALLPGARPAQYGPNGVANRPGVDFSADSKLWPSLMAAGFGMMASRSPFAGVAIGEGALTGLGTYSGMKQGEQQRALQERKLAIEADRWERDYAVKLKQAQTNEMFRQSLADRSKYQWLPGTGYATDENGKPVMGPDGKPVPVPGMFRTPTQSSDPNPEAKFYPGQTVTGRTTRSPQTDDTLAMRAANQAQADVANRDKEAMITGKPSFASAAEREAYKESRSKFWFEYYKNQGGQGAGVAPHPAGAPATPAGGAGAPPRPRVTNKAQYDALPSGREFEDTNGKIWKKP